MTEAELKAEIADLNDTIITLKKRNRELRCADNFGDLIEG